MPDKFTDLQFTTDYLPPAGTSNTVRHERILRYLLARMVTGEPVTLADAPVREFLGLPDDAAENPERYLPRLLEALGGATLMTCPKCRAKVKDIPGVTEESCPFCGEFVGSER